MKKLLVLCFALCYFTNFLAAQDFQSVYTLGDTTNKIVTASKTHGNFTYIAGVFSGTLNLANTQLISAGGNDIFLAKISHLGVVQWVRHIGGSSDDRIYDMAIDKDGNCFIIGYFTNTATIFNPGGANVNLTSANGGKNCLVVQYSPTGSIIQHMGWDIPNQTWGTAIETRDFLTYAAYSVEISPGNEAFVVLSLPFNGMLPNYTWGKLMGNNTISRVNGIAIDNDFSLIAVGHFKNYLNTGSGSIPGRGETDAFIIKVGSDGILEAAGIITGETSTGDVAMFNKVTVSNNNNIYVVGSYYGNLLLGNQLIQSAGDTNMLLFRFSHSLPATNFGLNWMKEIHSTANVVGDDVYANGNLVFLTGRFNGTLNTGMGTYTSAGGYNMFALCYNSSGSKVWGKTAGNQLNSSGVSIWGEASGNARVVGNFQGTVDFGNHTKTSIGANDIFIANIQGSQVPNLTATYSTSIGCPGGAINIQLLSPAAFNDTNVFTIEVSDENGSFVNPSVVRTVANKSPVSVHLEFPFSLPAGNNYKIRVSSSSPVSSFVGPSFPIAARPEPATILGPEIVSYKQDVNYYIKDPEPASTYLWKVEKGSLLGTSVGNQIRVIWGSSEYTGYVLAVKRSEQGCYADTTKLAVEVTNNTSIAASQSLYNIEIFPNPTTDKITISSKQPLVDDITVIVINSTGQIVQNQVFNFSEHDSSQIDLSSLPNGIYVLKLESSKGIKHLKVVKN